MNEDLGESGGAQPPGEGKRQKDAFDVAVEVFLTGVAGVVVSWIVLAFVAGSLDSARAAWFVPAVGAVALVAFMVPRRTRRMATRASVVLAIGFIVGSSFCAGVINSGG